MQHKAARCNTVQQPDYFERSTGANMPDHRAAALPDSPENSQKLVCYLICCISWQQRRLLEFLQFSMRWNFFVCVCVCVLLYSFERTLSEFVPVSIRRRLRCTSMSTRNFSLRFGSSSLCKTWVCVCVCVYVCVWVSRKTMRLLERKVFSRRKKEKQSIKQEYKRAQTSKLSCFFFCYNHHLGGEVYKSKYAHTHTNYPATHFHHVSGGMNMHTPEKTHTHTHTHLQIIFAPTRTHIQINLKSTTCVEAYIHTLSHITHAH